MSVWLNILNEIWAILLEMAPYLLLGFFLAGLLSVLIPQNLVERWLGRRGFASVVKASLLGVPLPLCSCGVIPLTTSLYKHGASKGATTSFLTSTPQTGVDSILATLGLMGPFFTWFRVVVALVSGIIAGLLVDLFETNPKAKEPARPNDKPQPPSSWLNKLRAIVKYGFFTLPQDIGKSLILGIVLAGLLGGLLPENWGETYLGNPWLTYLGVTMIAIPIYVCSTGSIPIAFALMASGVSPGAALVFLIAGPATNAATVTTLYKILGRRTIAIYLLTIVFVSWISGWILDTYGVSRIEQSMEHLHGKSGFSILQYLSGISLVGIVIWAFLYPKFQEQSSSNTMKTDETITLKVAGMTCSHCAGSVVKTLGAIPGVTSAKADQNQNLAWVEGKDIDRLALEKAIGEAGYEFKGFA